MSETKGYTRLTLEVQFDDGEKLTRIVEDNNPDKNIADMGDMLEELLLAVGYHPENVRSLFEQECEYVPEDPEVLYGDKRSFDMDGRTIFDLEDDNDDVDDWETVYSSECIGCTECCEDTACLHRHDEVAEDEFEPEVAW